MASTPTMNYYASGRDPILPPETVQIFSRTSIHHADRNTDEGKIDAISATIEKIAEHSDHVSRDTLSFRNEIRDSMMSDLGLKGGEGTYKCPFMKVAFANAIKADYEEAVPIDCLLYTSPSPRDS